MSIEVETQESESSNGQLIPSVVPTDPQSGLPIWRQRRYQIAALSVALVFVAVLFGNNMLARQYTPDGAVREYMGALQSGDAGKAWDSIQVASPTAPVAATITDRSALQAALVAGKPDIKNFTVTSTSQLDPTTTAVEVTYDSSGGSKQAKFLVRRSGETHFGIYPVWHVVVTPTILQVTVPKGSDGVIIDSKTIALPEGKSMVAVLPLVHKVQFTATAMLAARPGTVDSFGSLAQPVPFTPTLTAGGLAKAKAAVSAYFDNCTKQTTLSPTGCPQSLSNFWVGSGQWQLVGDPTKDLSVTFDQNLNPTGTGHFQMVFAFQEDGYAGTRHSPSSGGYTAVLVLASSDIAVASISSAAGLPVVERPGAATDQAAKDLVTQGFAQCAGARAAAQADCPQGLAFPDVSNVTWTLNGDPLSGATVSFDPQSGLLTVQGNFNMTTKYYVQGYPYTRASYNTTYKAYLFWDGQALKLVTISGDLG